MHMETSMAYDPILATPTYPPRTIQDEEGEVVGVIVSRSDYVLFLRALAAYTDWEMLPPHLQDAVDNMLADEALSEGGEPRAFRDLLAEEQE